MPGSDYSHGVRDSGESRTPCSIQTGDLERSDKPVRAFMLEAGSEDVSRASHRPDAERARSCRDRALLPVETAAKRMPDGSTTIETSGFRMIRPPHPLN